MEAPTITIKIKGLQAVEAVGAKGQLLGLKGGATTIKLGELEAKQAIMTKNGLVLKEVEGHAVLDAPKAATKALAKGAAGGKGAVVVKGAKAVMVPTSTAMSAKGLGWSLGLGGLGPWLALGALGLAATGLYFYFRAQAMEQQSVSNNRLEDIDVPT